MGFQRRYFYEATSANMCKQRYQITTESKLRRYFGYDICSRIMKWVGAARRMRECVEDRVSGVNVDRVDSVRDDAR